MYPAKAADVRRVVRSLSDDVGTLIDELDAARHAIFTGVDLGAQRDPRILVRGLQHKLATIFGERRGWRLSASGFPPALLARRGVSTRTADAVAGGWTCAVADHPFFYRATDRRAAAVAAHLYEARDRAAIRGWAAAHRLRVGFPTDFPSWWIPGGTTLCVYEPLDEVAEVCHG